MKNALYTILLLIASIGLQAQDNRITPPEEDDVVVGAIGGTIDVSALGGATYTIPIQMPQGVNGMQPNISVVYNSQSGNGLLGWNWNLAGLSAITRVNQTIYHDGVLKSVNFNDDRYALDGQRLIAFDGVPYDANGAQYFKEMDDMTKVVSFTLNGIDGPAGFRVWMANGITAYYGSHSNSRITLQENNAVCMWLLDSIVDRSGNYMTYDYEKGGSHFVLSHIRYSGNNVRGTLPQFSVNFIYDRRIDKEIAFIGDSRLNHTKLLKQITITKGYYQLYQYDFDYWIVGESTLYHMLKTINFSSGGYHYYPTTIEWKDDFSSKPTTQKIHLSNGGTLDKKVVKFSGDFNGDGFSDIITAEDWDGHSYTKASVLINEGVADDGMASFNKIKEFELNKFINWIYVADYSGDGLDDIMFANREERTGMFERDRVTLDFYITRIINGEISFENKATPYPNDRDFRISRNKRDCVLIGDFSGEGKQSVLIQFDSPNKIENKIENPRIARNFLIRYEGDAFTRAKSYNIIDADKMYPADYDGDGVTEILCRAKNGSITFTKILRLKFIDGLFSDFDFDEVMRGFPQNWEECYPGDFNGDGKTDALFCYKDDSGYNWVIFLYKENFFSSDGYRCPYLSSSYVHINIDSNFNLRKKFETSEHIKIADFNGDGKADIAYINNDCNIVVDYGGIHDEGNTVPFAWEQVINRNHFAWFSNMDMCIGNFYGNECAQMLGSNRISNVVPLSSRFEVKHITDGMGNRCEFEFGRLINNPLSNNNVYTMTGAGQSQGHEVRHVSLPIKVAKCIKAYNIYEPEPINETRYEYENLLLHRKGRGILGFRKTTQLNYISGVPITKSVTNYEIQTTGAHAAALPSSTLVYDGEDILISETHNSFQKCVNVVSNKFKSYMVVPIKQTTDNYELLGNRDFLRRRIAEYHYESDWNFPNYLYRVRNTITKTGTDNNYVDTADECEFISKIETNYCSDNTTNWIINRPQTIISTQSRRGDYDDKFSISEYEYEAQNPYQASKVTTTPNGSDAKATYIAYQYDEFGNIIEERKAAVAGGPSRKTTYEYSNDGRFLKTQRIDAGNNNTYDTEYQYNTTYGYRALTTDCNGFASYFKNDDHLGITTTTYDLDQNNNYIPGTQSVYARRWAANSGYAIHVQDIRNARFFSWSRSSGQMESLTFFDALGRKVRTVNFGLTKSDAIYQDFSYDRKGRLAKTTDPYFATDGVETAGYTEMEYDNFDRITKTIYKDCQGIALQIGEIDYDGLQTNTTSYRSEDNKQIVSDRLNVMGWKEEHIDYINPNLDDPSNSESPVMVNYDYNADGTLAWTMVNQDENTKIVLNYDEAGNRTELIDPDYGRVSSYYDAFGQLRWTTTPKGDLTEYDYDRLGRAITRTETDTEQQQTVVTNWIYSEEEGTKGLLHSINYNNGTQSIVYNYDGLNRTETIEETLFGQIYTTRYGYDSYSRLKSIEYPTHFKATHVYYTDTGHKMGIKNDEGKWLWRLNAINALGQVTQYQTGDGTISTRSYDNMHRLEIQSSMNGENKTQDFIYTYDDFSNLESRTENKYATPLTEHFTYDHLNRLETTTLNGVTSTMVYDPHGRILSKQSEGQTVFDDAHYEIYDDYGVLKPHAISSASAVGSSAINTMQSIDYTMFDKVKTMTISGSNRYMFDYGYDHERTRMTYTKGGIFQMQKTYVGNCEFYRMYGEFSFTYLIGPLGVFAAVNKSGESENISYIHKDNLGSWTTITDRNGNIVNEQSFDAWGNRRNPYTWTGLWAGGSMFDRGFTGHEHIFTFDAPLKDVLINMNGRLYDPIMSSFLSVDSYVQQPDNSQNFNRYAYCLNNPLKYTDPSGEEVLTAIVAGAFLGTLATIISQGENSLNDPYFMGKVAIGAIAGALGGYVGAAVGAALPFAGFYGGAVSGSAAGAAGGFVNGFGNAGLSGYSLDEALMKGFLASNSGAFTGGLMGGVSGGLYAYRHNGDFFTGDGMIHKLLSPHPSSEKVTIPDDMEYTLEYVERMKKECFMSKAMETIKKSVLTTHVKMEIPPNSNFKIEGDLMVDLDSPLDENGQHAVVDGATRYVKGGSYKSDVYLFKTAFTSKEKLYLTMAHEYIHAGFDFFQRNTVSEDYQHAAIYKWQEQQSLLWGIDASRWAENALILENAGYFRKNIYNDIFDMGFIFWQGGVKPW